MEEKLRRSEEEEENFPFYSFLESFGDRKDAPL